MENTEVKIRLPEIDRLMQEANTKHVSIVCVKNTEKEKEELNKIDSDLNDKLNYVNLIITEVLDHLRSRGCDVSKYI